MNPTVRKALASKEKRFLNFIIDIVVRAIFLVVLGITSIIILNEIGYEDLAFEIENLDDKLIEYAIEYVFLIVYFMLFETFTQQSIGKFITQTKVLKIDGSKPTVVDILKRTFSRIVPFEPFSFLGGSLTGWHDDWSNTVVVDLKKYTSEQLNASELDEIGRIED